MQEVPLWVKDPLNHCSRCTKNKLKSAIKSIEISKHVEEDIHTVANFVFPKLIEESFRDLKFEMQYSYVSKLKYLDIKQDKNFLPTSFNSSAHNSEADDALLIVLPDGKKFPILFGELKREVKFKEFKISANPPEPESDYLQLLNYMLTVQRPYSVNETKSQLVGFLMDCDEAFIFRLRVGFWTDYLMFPSNISFYLSD